MQTPEEKASSRIAPTKSSPRSSIRRRRAHRGAARTRRSRWRRAGLEYALTVDLPEDFALDQPLSPFLLAALELLDPESETYTMDLISMVEATLEDPAQVLRAQERAARDRAMAEMKSRRRRI